MIVSIAQPIVAPSPERTAHINCQSSIPAGSNEDSIFKDWTGLFVRIPSIAIRVTKILSPDTQNAIFPYGIVGKGLRG